MDKPFQVQAMIQLNRLALPNEFHGHTFSARQQNHLKIRHKNRLPINDVVGYYQSMGHLEGLFMLFTPILCEGEISLSVTNETHELSGEIQYYSHKEMERLENIVRSIDGISSSLAYEYDGEYELRFAFTQSVKFSRASAMS